MALLLRPRKSPRVIAHRGGAGDHPENTLAAGRAALLAGAEMLEFDLRPTADGVWVALHDSDLDRTTDGVGPLARHTWSGITRMRVRFPESHRAVSLESIPRLEDILSAFPSTPLSLEIKAGGRGDLSRLLSTISGAGAENRVVLGSARAWVTRRVRQEAPQVATHATPGEVVLSIVTARLLGRLWPWSGCSVLTLPPCTARGWRLFTPSLGKAARQAGVPVHLWTLNDRRAIRRYLAEGADGVVTDWPALAVEEWNRLDIARQIRSIGGDAPKP